MVYYRLSKKLSAPQLLLYTSLLLSDDVPSFLFFTKDTAWNENNPDRSASTVLRAGNEHELLFSVNYIIMDSPTERFAAVLRLSN